LKPKTCKQCKAMYTPTRPLQSVCGFECAIAQSRAKQEAARRAAERKEKRAHRERREGLKTRSQWLREAQTAFNAYIRERDRNKPCISCGATYGDVVLGGKVDAGHYRGTGAAPEYRFHLLNCWAQCVKCNRNLSGNSVEYRKGLIRRIGLERVETLESDNAPRKFTIDYLRRLKRLMNRRARHYKRLRDGH
jgi:hypothetical protein